MIERAGWLWVGVAAAAVLGGACSKESKQASPPEQIEWNRSCTADAYCSPSPGCCPEPCTSDVVNVSELERAYAWVKAHCDPDEECPVAGDCEQHAYLCVRGTCAIVFEGHPDFRKAQ